MLLGSAPMTTRNSAIASSRRPRLCRALARLTRRGRDARIQADGLAESGFGLAVPLPVGRQQAQAVPGLCERGVEGRPLRSSARGPCRAV